MKTKKTDNSLKTHRKKLFMACLFLTCVFVWTGASFSQQDTSRDPAGESAEKKIEGNRTTDQGAGPDAQISTGTYPLIGRDLITRRGKNVGEVENVIVNYDGQVEKVIVDVGGFLGLGEKRVAIPLDTLRLSKWNEAVYQGTEEELEEMDEYESPERRLAWQRDRYPYGRPYATRWHDPYWTRRYDPYTPGGYGREGGPYGWDGPMYDRERCPYSEDYGYRCPLGRRDRDEPRWHRYERKTHGRRGGPDSYRYGREQGDTGPGRMDRSRFRISDLMDQTVTNPQGEEIGTVEDIIISEDGQKVQAVISVGGFMGLGDKKISVPLEELSRREGKVICNLCKAEIEREPGYTSTPDENVDRGGGQEKK